jgi:hypothetical protein
MHLKNEGRPRKTALAEERNDALRPGAVPPLLRHQRFSSLGIGSCGRLKGLRATSSCGSGNDRQHARRRLNGGREAAVRFSGFRYPVARRAHSSSGLGRRPLTAVARVRIPYAPPRPPCLRKPRMVAWVRCARRAGNARGVPTPVPTSHSRPPRLRHVSIWRVFWPQTDRCARRSGDNVVQFVDYGLGWLQTLLTCPCTPGSRTSTSVIKRRGSTSYVTTSVHA